MWDITEILKKCPNCIQEVTKVFPKVKIYYKIEQVSEVSC